MPESKMYDMDNYMYHYTDDGDRIVLKKGERNGQPAWVKTDLAEIPSQFEKTTQRGANIAADQRGQESMKALIAAEQGGGAQERRKLARDLPFWEAAAISLPHGIKRMKKGLWDINNFLQYLAQPEITHDIQRGRDPNWKSPMEKKLEHDKQWDDYKTLMGEFDIENPGAQVVGELPMYMGTGAVLNPLTRRVASPLIKGAMEAPGAVAAEGRGALQSFVNMLQRQPGKIGQVGERMYQESVVPRQVAARARARRQTIVDPAIKGQLDEVGGHTITGALEGAIDPNMSMTAGSLNSLLGSFVGQKLKRATHQTPNYWLEPERELLDWFENQGGRLLPGMSTGSHRLQRFEGALNQQERLTDWMNLINQENRIVTNKTAWEAAGIPYGTQGDITKDVLKNHMKNLKSEYDTIQAQSKGLFEPSEYNMIGQHIGDLKKNKTKAGIKASNTAQDYWARIRQMSKPRLRNGNVIGFGYQGKDFQRLRSDLKAELDSAYKNNDIVTVRALEPMLKRLDTSLERGVQNLGQGSNRPELLNQYKDLNERYAMTKLLLEKGTDVTTGAFDGRRFLDYLKSADPQRAILEEGNRIVPLMKLAKVQDLMRRQAKPGISGSDDLPLTKTGNKESLSLPQKLFTMNKYVGMLNPLERVMMNAYARGYPSRTGLFNFGGKRPWTNTPDYMRAFEQSSGLAGDVIEKGYETAKDVYQSEPFQMGLEAGGRAVDFAGEQIKSLYDLYKESQAEQHYKELEEKRKQGM